MQCTLPNVLTKNQRRRLNKKLKVDLLSNQLRTLALVPTGNPQQKTVPSQNKKRGNRRRNRNPGGSLRGRQNTVNQYLRSLQDPINNPGAKVPDLVSFPSSTFQLTQEMELKSLVVGCDAVGICLTPLVAYPGSGPIFMGSNSSIGGNLSWFSHNWHEKAGITTLYDNVRPVSAEISIEFVGNSTEDQGQFILGLLPRSTVGTSPVEYLLNADAARAEAFSTSAMVKDGWAKVVWKPQDSMDLEYFECNIGDSSHHYPPAIYIIAAGLKPQSSVFRVTVVANFEGIPSKDTFNLVNAEPSPINSLELETAMRWAGQRLNNFYTAAKGFTPFLRPMAESFARSVGPRLGRAAAGRILG